MKHEHLGKLWSTRTVHVATIGNALDFVRVPRRRTICTTTAFWLGKEPRWPHHRRHGAGICGGFTGPNEFAGAVETVAVDDGAAVDDGGPFADGDALAVFGADVDPGALDVEAPPRFFAVEREPGVATDDADDADGTTVIGIDGVSPECMMSADDAVVSLEVNVRIVEIKNSL